MERSNKKTKMLILLNVVIITFMSSIDSSIVNVALPEMAKKLSVSTAAIGWIVTSYLIAIVSMILIFGRLGDIKGTSRVFIFGTFVFTLGSFMCAISNSLFFLIVSRAVQGLGASATMAIGHGIITQVFPSGERGRAYGLNATFVALGSMLGPPLGGFIIDILSWRYIFLINLPIGILAFIIQIKFMPKPTGKTEGNIDWVGAVLFALSSILIFGSLILGENIGYHNPMIISALAVGLICFILFINIEKKLKEPLLQLNIFKNKLFSLNIFCAFLSFIGISCSMFIQPFYLQSVMNLSPTHAGMIIMTFPIILSIAAPFSGYLSDKIGSEVLTFFGLIFTSLSFYLMTTLNEYTHLPTLIVFTAILAAGNGLFQSPNNALVMSNVSSKILGVAGSVNSLVRNLGMILGVSLSIMLLYSRMSHMIGYQVSNYIPGRADVFIYGMKGVYFTAAVLSSIGTLLTAVRLYHKKRNQKIIELQSD